MPDNAESIAYLVREIGEAGRLATPAEVERLRAYFADVVLERVPEWQVLIKYEQHVMLEDEWPPETSPDDYVQSLQGAVRSRAGGIYFVRERRVNQWSVLFLVPARRWRGARGGSHIVVVFNADRGWWVTGFQLRGGERYLARQGGLWARRPG